MPPGKTVSLEKWPTNVKPICNSKKHYKKLLENQVEELSDLQSLHYASNRHALLLIFQAMDAAGKDGAIRHVMSGVNPQGCQVFSFQQPSAEELDHDFLWCTTRRLPERGWIAIAPSWISRHISIGTAPGSSNSFSTYRRMSKRSVLAYCANATRKN